MIVIFVLLFFLFPLFGLVLAIPRFRQPVGKIIIFLFFVYTALLLIPYKFGDITLYGERQQLYNHLSFLEFLTQFLARKLVSEGEGFEVYIDFVVFVASRITDDVHLAFAITAAVVFAFWQKIVSFLVAEYDEKNKDEINRNAICILICFAVYIIFYRAINARFYLSYWISILGFYHLLVRKDKKGYLILFSAILVHQSYVFFFGLILINQLIAPLYKIRRTEYVLYVLIILGSTTSQLGFSLLKENVALLGSDFERYNSYTKTSYVQRVTDRERTWFQELRGPLLFYTLFINILYLRWKKSAVLSLENRRIYFFILLMFAVNAFTINIPSFGDRFRNVLMGLMLLLLFRWHNQLPSKKLSIPVRILLLAFVFYKLISIKILQGYLNLWSFSPFSIYLQWIYDAEPLPI